MIENGEKISYKNAYCDIGEKKEYSLDELNKISSEYGGLGAIAHHLLCPNCKIAKLSYTAKTNKRRAFL